jgi:hypothetical protein
VTRGGKELRIGERDEAREVTRRDRRRLGK